MYFQFNDLHTKLPIAKWGQMEKHAFTNMYTNQISQESVKNMSRKIE